MWFEHRRKYIASTAVSVRGVVFLSDIFHIYRERYLFCFCDTEATVTINEILKYAVICLVFTNESVCVCVCVVVLVNYLPLTRIDY